MSATGFSWSNRPSISRTPLAMSGAPGAGTGLAQHGPHRRPDLAYKWYFIALVQQGYTVAFHDLNGSPSDYRGPVGDCLAAEAPLR